LFDLPARLVRVCQLCGFHIFTRARTQPRFPFVYLFNCHSKKGRPTRIETFPHCCLLGLSHFYSGARSLAHWLAGWLAHWQAGNATVVAIKAFRFGRDGL
jgi:hypothetical protein